jgi:hypothetical protein
VIVIGPAAMPAVWAMVMFPTDVPTLGGALNESAAVAAPVAVAVAVAFGDCAGAVEGVAPAEAADGAGAPEDRDDADAVSAEADKDWLAEQPATARAAKTAQKTAQAGETFTLLRRAAAAAGARGYRADVGQRRSRDVDPSRSRYGFLAIPQ